MYLKSYTLKTTKESKNVQSSRSGFVASCHSCCLAGSQKSKAAFTLAAGKLACTNTLETAKEVRSTVKNTLAPCGRGQNLLANECELRNSGEGSGKSALTHEGTAKEAHDSLRHPCKS